MPATTTGTDFLWLLSWCVSGKKARRIRIATPDGAERIESRIPRFSICTRSTGSGFALSGCKGFRMKKSQGYTRIPVEPGRFVVGREKKEILEAYLGTCVGVALYDRVASVGGLAHFILPEPTSSDISWEPETNARMGLPMFIDALVALGASEERLEAVVAGGALVEPLCSRDIYLDIGGKNSEVVETILSERHIPVVAGETGGYFSCRLSLSLATWETAIEPIGMLPRRRESGEFAKPSAQAIEESIECVRPVPQIALKIIRMIGDSTHSFRELSMEVARDQVISARVLRLCNSAGVSAGKRIDSIDRALVLLGDKRLLQLAISTGVEDYLSQSEQGYSLCKGGLFRHALGTAKLSRSLAALTHKAPPDLAYTAGLLHDIGKVALDQYMAEAYPLFYRRLGITGRELIEVEKEVFGIAHTEAGRILAERWKLPLSIIDVVACHHHPDESAHYPGLTLIVHLADLIMSRFAAGNEIEMAGSADLKKTLHRLGIEPENFSAVISAMMHSEGR